jgi:hypothetical protein
MRAFPLRLLLAMGFVSALCSGAVAQGGAVAQEGAVAQQARPCQVVSVKEAGLLLGCADQLKGFLLTFEDVRRQVASEAQGRFVFACVLGPMCENEPNVGGFFIDPVRWRESAKDEPAMLDILQQYGLVPAAARGADPNAKPPPACAVFDVQIGDLPGRAVCFDVADGSAVIVIAGDDQVALVLSIFQRKRTPGAMREKAMDMIPLFRMQRPTGDITLLRWIR